MKGMEQALARELFHTQVIESGSGTEIAERTKAVAAEIEGMQEATQSQASFVFTGQEFLPPEGSGEGTTVTPEISTLGGQIDVGLLQENADADWGIVVDTLQNTAEDVQEVVGAAQTEEIEGNTVGYAYQGVTESSVIDVTAAIKEDAPGASLIDTANLEDTVMHEDEHELQAKQWNAESVKIVGVHKNITRLLVSEVGAMSRQKTVAQNSADYQEMWSFLTGMISAKEAKEAARKGDLVGLAQKINEKRGNTEDISVTEGAGKA